MYISSNTFYDYAHNVLNIQQPYLKGLNFNFDAPNSDDITNLDFSITELAASPEVARYFYGQPILNNETGYYDLDFNSVTEHY